MVECVILKKFRVSFIADEHMSLDNEKCLTIVKRYKLGVCTALLAAQFGVSQRRIQQLIKCAKSGKLPEIRPRGRKCKPLCEHTTKQIVSLRNQYRWGATYIATYLRERKNVCLGHDRIHAVLRQQGMVQPNMKKQKRRKPWVRYERTHSLSAGHMDWTVHNNKHCCVVLDDASRMILAGDEFNEATTEHSIALIQQVLDKYGHIRRIREIITDHGTQFYANKRNKDGSSAHSFELYCYEQDIRHILCQYKHPQSNGKVEKWFDCYKRYRDEFDSFEKFVDWYNNRPHGSLDFNTPQQAFWQKLQGFVLQRFLTWAEKNEKQKSEIISG